MKNVKFALLAFGILSVIAVFLPYISIESTSISLWQLGKVASEMGESAAPVYAVLLTGFALTGVTGFAVSQKRMGRGLAAGALVACCAMLFFTFKMGAPAEGLLNVGAAGAYILVFGGLIAFFVSLAALIKPERAALS